MAASTHVSASRHPRAGGDARPYKLPSTPLRTAHHPSRYRANHFIQPATRRLALSPGTAWSGGFPAAAGAEQAHGRRVKRKNHITLPPLYLHRARSGCPREPRPLQRGLHAALRRYGRRERRLTPRPLAGEHDDRRLCPRPRRSRRQKRRHTERHLLQKHPRRLNFSGRVELLLNFRQDAKNQTA